MNKWNNMLMMSDWCIDSGIGWFVTCFSNVLFKFDIQKKILSVVSAIPTKKAGPFQNSFCVKCQNLIYCIPTYENRIWCYDIILEQWRAITICNDQSLSVMAAPLGEYRNVFYFFSAELKIIYGIDLVTGNTVYKYSIDVKETNMHYCSHGILIESKVYFVFGGTTIYEFDLELQIQKKYDFPDFDDDLFGITYDGKNFWLIGKKAKVYVYDKEKTDLYALENFPQELILYDFCRKMKIEDLGKNVKSLRVFNDIYCLNGKIWLIAASVNKILYCGLVDRKIGAFEIRDEEENTETLDLNYRITNAKFRLLYIREKCYMGIYSYKNKLIIEINTLKMTYQIINYEVDKYSVDNMPIDKIPIQEFQEDGCEFTNLLYNTKMFNSSLPMPIEEPESVGGIIYAELCND